MKLFVAIAAILAAVGAATASDGFYCHSQVTIACKDSEFIPTCDARYGGIEYTENEIQKHINLQLSKSYQYLLMATFFDSYQKDRPGFQKLYQGLSDRSFDNAIDLIKQVTRRGGSVDFGAIHEEKDGEGRLLRQPTVEVNELHSLAFALDIEKTLAKHANHVTYVATHVHKLQDAQGKHVNSVPDPEMAHYMEEKILHEQSGTVRQLSGYANDLAKMMSHSDPSIALYLFDQHLQK